MARRFLLFPLFWLVCFQPTLAAQPEIDAGLIQMLEGDVGLDVGPVDVESGGIIEPILDDPQAEGESIFPPAGGVRGGVVEPDLGILPDEILGIEDEGSLEEAAPPLPEDFIPALLTVERRQQFATACQYWVKLENRLPFKIRNMALRFTTYLKNDNYDRPVVFDTEVRSFSELRPTDSQYRDIFYPNVDCEDLNYIRVEDVGHCAMGALTKFSTQEGDCVKFIEVQPSELICIFLDEGILDGENGGDSERNPCSIVNQYDIDRLLMKMIQTYNAGDAQGFNALFSQQVVSNQGKGLAGLKHEFPGLFKPGKGRSLKLGNVSWKPRGGGSTAIWLSFRIERAGSGEEKAGVETLRVAMRAYLHNGRLIISHFLHETR